MSVPDGKVPIFQSVQAAFTGWREGLVAIAPAAAICGAATGAIWLAVGPQAAANPGLSTMASGLAMLVQAVFYAFALRPALQKPGGLSAGGLGDGMRVFGSMAVVGFFLFILVVVAMIPAFAVLMTVLAPYAERIEAAGQDQAATMAIMQEIAMENPGPFVGLMLLYSFVWLALTSRLYLAAPASVDQGRVMSFETWSWTKGNMFRIIAARLLLLVPAFVVFAMLNGVVGALLGVRQGELGETIAPANPLAFGLMYGVSAFISLLIYSALEARLSAYLHAGLKPR